MADKRVDQLLARIGPVLFARAQRVLKDKKRAESLTREIIDALAKKKHDGSDAELLKAGREELEKRIARSVDSIVPK